MAIFPESDRLDMDDVSGIAPEDVFVAPMQYEDDDARAAAEIERIMAEEWYE